MTTTPWEKSDRSAVGNCVQFRRNGRLIEIGDDKDPDGPTLLFTTDEFAAMLGSAKDGQFDKYAIPLD
jgi:hypothetical protein